MIRHSTDDKFLLTDEQDRFYIYDTMDGGLSMMNEQLDLREAIDVAMDAPLPPGGPHSSGTSLTGG